MATTALHLTGVTGKPWTFAPKAASVPLTVTGFPVATLSYYLFATSNHERAAWRNYERTSTRVGS